VDSTEIRVRGKQGRSLDPVRSESTRNRHLLLSMVLRENPYASPSFGCWLYSKAC